MPSFTETQKPTVLEPLITKEEACRYLKMSPRKIDYLRSNGTLPYVKLEGQVRFRICDLNMYIEHNVRNKVA